MYSDESSDKLSDESEKLYRAVEIVQSAAHSNPRRSETDIPGGCLAPFTPRWLRIRLREDVVVSRRRAAVWRQQPAAVVGILISKLPRRQITVDPNKASSPLTRSRQRFPGRGRGPLPRGGCFDKGCDVVPLPRFILPSLPFAKRALLTPLSLSLFLSLVFLSFCHLFFLLLPFLSPPVYIFELVLFLSREFDPGRLQSPSGATRNWKVLMRGYL